MKSFLYVITDTKARRTTEPFSCPSDESAKRNYLQGCFASNTPPQDCLLWRVGTFDIDSDDCNLFQISDTKLALVSVTVEEIEAYSKIFNMMNNEEIEA